MAHYNLIIIGSGPSGRAAAIQAGKLKRKVLVVDRNERLGGVSVHTGTIPSKTLRETVLNLTGWRERSFYGRAYRVKDQIKAEDLKARLHMLQFFTLESGCHVARAVAANVWMACESV